MGTDTEGNPEGGGKPKGNDKYVNKKPFIQKKSFATAGAQLIKHVKFEGASADLRGHVFDVMSSKIKQIDEYNSTLEQIMTYVGTHMDPFVLEAIEELSPVSTLTEPVPVTQSDGSVSTIEMKKWEKGLICSCQEKNRSKRR